MKYSKDHRDPLWATLERDIQSRSSRKDKKFILAGPWKRLFRTEGKLIIYLVDGAWVQNNLSVIFGHGGHGLVHEFIPLSEIWISRKHFKDCKCKKKSENQIMSAAAIESTIVHEMVEYGKMKKGMPYWDAHRIADAAERKAGFLQNPYDDSRYVV